MTKLGDLLESSKNTKFADWFRPLDGDNRVRVLSMDNTEVLPQHWIQSLKKSYACFGKDKGCPYDTWADVPVRENGQVVFQVDGKTPVTERKLVHRPGKKYLLWIIDRKDGNVKIGEFTYGVVKSMCETFENYKKQAKEEGKIVSNDSPWYDVTIKKSKKGPKKSDVEYTVIPERGDTLLTEDEEKLTSNLEDLKMIVDKMKEKSMKAVADSSTVPSTSGDELPDVIDSDA